MLTVRAPAKLNVTLEVLGKRQDGFHEIRSVMQTISLSDTLSFQSGENIEFRCNLPGWIAMESLVSKATYLLRQVTDGSKGATIKVEKRIPLLSGLGGDSSDAAAALRGLNQLWGLDLSLQELAELARQLGSDIAFFLYGGTGLAEGRGELVTPLPPLPHRWVILIIPPVSRPPGKTKQLYASLKASHFTDGQITERLVEALKAGKELTSSLLFNTFERVAPAHFLGLKEYQEQTKKTGAPDVHLAGSGPALFTLFKDKTQAEELNGRLQQQGLESHLAETLSAVEQQIV